MSNRTDIVKIAWKEAKTREKDLDKQLKTFKKIYKAMSKVALGDNNIEDTRIVLAPAEEYKEYLKELDKSKNNE